MREGTRKIFAKYEIGGTSKTLLVESDKRKCAFLKQVARQLELDIEVKSQRIEAIDDLTADLLTCRAFRSLGQIFELMHKNSHENSKWVLHKGQGWAKEVEEAQNHWRFSLDVEQSLTNEHSRILLVQNVTRI